MEDQEIMEHFMENKQGYVIDNMNAVAGCGNGVGEEMGNAEEIMGVKYDEQLHEQHDVGDDDDELKYVKEVQQSEKQHLENVGDGRTSNELAEKDDVDNYEVGLKEENMHNKTDIGIMPDSFKIDNINGHHESIVVGQIIQATGEASTTSTDTIHSTGTTDVEKEDDASALISNADIKNASTQPACQNVEGEKENISLMMEAEVESLTLQEDQDFQCSDIEQLSSQLNPDAKEFVPTFESSTKSPVASSEDVGEKDYIGHFPTAVPRLLTSEDDLIAQSPRKGRAYNMDTILVPAEQEFDEEADQRPHELEVDTEGTIVQEYNLDITDKNNQIELGSSTIMESIEIVDNGPETFVDVGDDAKISELSCGMSFEKGNDLMKQSIYLTSDEAIKNVLNSVQPIPTEMDSVNSSFTEELFNACSTNKNATDEVKSLNVEPLSDILFGDKELLQVEEKEHISKSPSSEEILLNLQTPHKDIFPDLFDMKDTPMIEESISADQDVQQEIATREKTNDCDELIDSVKPLGAVNNILETSDYQIDLCTTHSSSAEEKHLLEDTKESLLTQDISSLYPLVGEIALDDDGKQSQANENKIESPSTNNNGNEIMDSIEITCNTSEPKLILDETANKDETEFISSLNKEGHSYEGNHSNVVNKNATLNNVISSNDIKCDTQPNIGYNEIKKSDNMHEDEILDSPVPESYAADEHHVMNSFIRTDDSVPVIVEPLLKEKFAEQRCKEESYEVCGTNEEGIDKPSLEVGNEIHVDINEENVEMKQETDEEPTIESYTNDIITEKPCSVTGMDSVTNIKPLDMSNESKVKKIGFKSITNSSKVKTNQPLQTTTKKLATAETAKKPSVAAQKPKPAVVKSATTTSTTSERKLIKPLTSAATVTQKLKTPATAAAKIPLKATSSSRPTQITTSTTKSAASRPVAAARNVTSASSLARKPTAPGASSITKTRPASSSTGSNKPNTLTAAGMGPSKPIVLSPRPTLTSQMRKPPAPTVTTVKSPVKSTVASSLTKTSVSGTRQKPPLSAVSITGTAAIKPTNTRSAPKVPTSSTTSSSRRVTVGILAGSTVSSNAPTKNITARNSSPIKPPPGKTTTKPISSITKLNTKTAVQAKSSKINEKKIIEHSEINGGVPSNNAANINVINGNSQETLSTSEDKQSLLKNDDLNSSKNYDSENIENLQENLIGAYGH